MRSPARALLVALAVVSFVSVSCAGEQDAGSSGDGPRVMVTTSILGEVVEEMASDAAEVEVLMGPGVDPHTFQASARQVAAVRQADLVVANGLGLEQNLLDTLQAAEEDGVPVVRVAEEVDPIPFVEADHSDGDGEEDYSQEDGGEGHSEEHAEEEHAEEDHGDEQPPVEPGDDSGESHEHGHGELDPHFWMDVDRMATAVEVVGEELANVDDSLSDQQWAERTEDYAGRLQRLNTEIIDILSVVPDEDRKLVTNHEAMGYFANAYGFELVGTVMPGGAGFAEPSAQELEELARTIEQEDVSAIFAENTAPDGLSEAVAEEANIEIEAVELYTDATGEEGSGAENYADMMRTNAELIAEALTPRD